MSDAADFWPDLPVERYGLGKILPGGRRDRIQIKQVQLRQPRPVGGRHPQQFVFCVIQAVHFHLGFRQARAGKGVVFVGSQGALKRLAGLEVRLVPQSVCSNLIPVASLCRGLIGPVPPLSRAKGNGE